jgi:N-glycosylase/DNA lyase
MKKLIEQINLLRKSSVRDRVESRLIEFENNKEWFSELCFCLLTANSKAKTAINIQNELGEKGFLNYDKDKIRETIIRNKHRFPNNKSNFIFEVRRFSNIKNILKDKDEFEAREFLVKNVKGLGYKEASHFLRNVGYKNLSILDRHIINLMVENKIIERPKSLTPKNYLNIEEKFKRICDEVKMNCAELDMYMWYLKTGEILK